MTAHEIQELLDGSLNDQQSAELLHRLSVSPEKRTVFRQHIALQSAMEEDKNASFMTSAEDAAVWNALAGISMTPVAPRFFDRWYGKWTGGAAIAGVALVIGLLLGNGSLGIRIFSANEHLDPTIAYNALSVASGTPCPLQPEQIAAVTSQYTSVLPVPVSTNTGSQKAAKSANTYQINSPKPGRQRSDVVADASPLHDTRDPAIASVLLREPKNQVWSDGASAYQQPQTLRNDYRRLPDRFTPVDEAMPSVTAFSGNGIEAAFNERIGVIAPVPAGVKDADPEFSYRNLDLSYRFGDGSYGVGGRLAYGTFARVTLQAQQQTRGDLGIPVTVYEPRLAAQKNLWVELFANYRHPLSDMVALGFEVSGGGSSSYLKASGDVYVVWLLTRNIGVQAGGGVGKYWYDLSGERDAILKTDENAGVTSEASTKYQGMILEGRYGLFFRF